MRWQFCRSNRVKKFSVKIKGVFQNPLFCFKIIFLTLLGLFLWTAGLSVRSLNYSLSPVFFSASISEINNHQMFVTGEIFISAPEISQMILIQETSVKGFSSPLTISNRVLAALMEGVDYQEARNIIIEYVVRQGDSLWSIANRFDISIDTIIWANNLRGTTIRIGQRLVILPVSGTMHMVRQGDTIGGIAEKYNAEKEEIVFFNNILEPENISIGQTLVIPGGTKSSTISVIRTANIDITTLTPNQVRAKFFTNNYWGQSHSFPFGQCTWWVAQKRVIGRWGHAKNWLSNASRDGFRICRGRNCASVAGAVIVVKGHPIYGHVAYVERVKGSEITFSEMNNIGWGRINKRTVQAGHHTIIGFIY